MSAAAAAGLNLVQGAVYLAFALVLAIELRRARGRFGYSHLGVALLGMAITCGAHHLTHGAHVAEGHPGLGVDAFATAVGLPFGAAWVALRIEAFRGGRGDRFVRGTPWTVAALPTATGVVAAAIVTATVARGGLDPEHLLAATPNLLLAPIYATIAVVLARTQVANRRPLGGWSASGILLACLFTWCTVMHGAHALLVLQGAYAIDAHLAIVDVASIPAGLYFLWAVHQLHRGRLPDWNRRARPPRQFALASNVHSNGGTESPPAQAGTPAAR